jgi:hypothetical protein
MERRIGETWFEGFDQRTVCCDGKLKVYCNYTRCQKPIEPGDKFVWESGFDQDNVFCMACAGQV